MPRSIGRRRTHRRVRRVTAGDPKPDLCEPEMARMHGHLGAPCDGAAKDGAAKPETGLGYAAVVSQLSRAELDELVAEAVVDAYNDDEQLTGLYTMIEDNLAMPFDTTVLGVEVTVRKVDLRADGIVAICHRGRDRQAIEVLDLPLPDPAPEGAQWIAAYRYWTGR